MIGSNEPKRPKKAVFQNIRNSRTYTNLLDSVMPSIKTHNAAKIAQRLGTPRPGDAKSLTSSSSTGAMSGIWSGPEQRTKPEEDDAFDSTIALYHDAIRSQMKSQSSAPNVAPPAMSSNRNCSVDIYDLPEATTMSHVLDAIAHHRPVGHVYRCDLLQSVGHGGCPLRVARVRLKAPESASRLHQIGKQQQPGLGLYVKGAKVGVRLTRVPTSAYRAEGTRVVVFRGPKHVVHTENLRKVWGGNFLQDQVQKIIQRPAGVDGNKEVEWRFYEFAWGAQVAKCLFENEYGRREDCAAWYGVDPCT